MVQSIEFSAVFHALANAIFNTLWQGIIAGIIVYGSLIIIPKEKANIRFWMAYTCLIMLFVLFAGNVIYSLGNAEEVEYIQAVINGGNPSVLIKSSPSANVGFWEASLYRVIYLIEDHSQLIALIWAVGVFTGCLRLLLGLRYIDTFQKKHLQYPSLLWNERFKDILRATASSRKIILRISDRLYTPVTFGWLKPIVVLPVNLFVTLSYEQIEFIIIHELAHIKRNDYLLNLIKSVIQNFLFFHPVMWWASVILEKEREKATDDLVLKIKKDPVTYIKTLTAVAESDASVFYAAMALFGHKEDLSSRILRIINHSNFVKIERTARSKSYVVAAILSLFLFLSVIGISIASQKKLAGRQIKLSEVVLERRAARVETRKETFLQEDTVKKKAAEHVGVAEKRDNTKTRREDEVRDHIEVNIGEQSTYISIQSRSNDTPLTNLLDIRSEEPEEPDFILDGKRITKEEFKNLDAFSIQSIEVKKPKNKEGITKKPEIFITSKIQPAEKIVSVNHQLKEPVNNQGETTKSIGEVRTFLGSTSDQEKSQKARSINKVLTPSENKVFLLDGIACTEAEIKVLDPTTIESVEIRKVSPLGNDPHIGIASSIVSVKSKTKENFATTLESSLYPNPASTESFVEVEMEREGSLYVQLVDINGVKIKDLFRSNTAKGRMKISWDASSLSKGTYFVVINKNHQISRKRVVVE
jgi:beta-lactamase regulating signal transducer with metallopeptidase domain